MKFFTDTHCHLNLPQYKPDLDSVIDRAIKSGIDRILVPGIDITSSKEAIELSKRYKGLIFAAVGVHPNSKEIITNHSLDLLMELAQSIGVVAIGEIGLDTYRNIQPLEIQKARLQKQLEIASQLGLPIIVHNRNSEDELFHILHTWYQTLLDEKSRLTTRPGVLHSFSGSKSVTDKFLEMNFFIGVGGPLTFLKEENYRNFISNVPLEKILIETDSPYLAPHPLRGQRNEPANVQYVSDKLAEIFQKEMDLINKTTFSNSAVLFNW